MAATNVQIRKFSSPQILFHWVYGISWIVLVLTGMIFIWRPDHYETAIGLGPLLQGSVGQWSRFLHRVAAIGLMVAPFIWLFGDTKTLGKDLKELLAFGKKDLEYMKIAPIHYTMGKPPLPPQGKYNGGHKMNFWIVILTFIVFIITGLTMWFGRGMVSKETFHLSQIFHSIAFWGGLCMGLVHMYLTAVHPFTSKALGAMLNGFMDLGYAKAEHKLWVDEELKNGTADLKTEGGVKPDSDPVGGAKVS